MNRNYLLAAQALLLSWASLARAEVVPNLYQADVPVVEQSAAELRRAARAGLAEVLVRVSGQTDAERNPALASSYADAERYLVQYRYERNPGPGGQPWVARLNFAGDQSERLLRGAGLPVWSANRPAILVLLAFDDGNGRGLVSEASHPELTAALREQARRRGLALHFPALDDADAQTLSAEDIWQLDTTKTQPALERYRADSVLLGRLTQSGGHWSGAWSLVAGEQNTGAEAEGESLPAALAPSFDKIADALAAQYAVAASGAAPEGVLLRLAGINNFDDYAQALACLQKQGGVKAVLPLQVAGDEVIVRLRIVGSAEQLSRQLALDSRLQPQAVDNSAFAGQAVALQYRWLRPAG